MKPISVAVIGTGWCGGIRAETLAAHPLVSSLHIAETNKARLDEISRKTGARTAVQDHKELLSTKEIQVV
jgi:scyllo-inositol 2-dehydrogenase (NAD+)